MFKPARGGYKIIQRNQPPRTQKFCGKGEKMDGNKFTQSSIQAINRCERIAAEYGNSAIAPIHILYALLDKDCIIPRILTRSGLDAEGLERAAK